MYLNLSQKNLFLKGKIKLVFAISIMSILKTKYTKVVF